MSQRSTYFFLSLHTEKKRTETNTYDISTTVTSVIRFYYIVLRFNATSEIRYEELVKVLMWTCIEVNAAIICGKITYALALKVLIHGLTVFGT